MGGELRDKVASGVAWSLGEKLGTILLQMVVSIVVARLLMPDDVGLMALMTFFSSLALVVVDSGFSQTLVRRTSPLQEDYKSVFLFNVTVSVALYLLLVALSPLLARYYAMPELTALHAAVPLRPALEGHLRRLAGERRGGRGAGAGWLRRLEHRGAAGAADGRAGTAALVAQLVAPVG